MSDSEARPRNRLKLGWLWAITVWGMLGCDYDFFVRVYLRLSAFTPKSRIKNRRSFKIRADKMPTPQDVKLEMITNHFSLFLKLLVIYLRLFPQLARGWVFHHLHLHKFSLHFLQIFPLGFLFYSPQH